MIIVMYNRNDYKIDLEEVEVSLNHVLIDIKNKYSDLFKNTPDYLGVQELKEKGAVLRILADIAEQDYYIGRRILNREILLGLKKYGIKLF